MTPAGAVDDDVHRADPFAQSRQRLTSRGVPPVEPVDAGFTASGSGAVSRRAGGLAGGDNVSGL